MKKVLQIIGATVLSAALFSSCYIQKESEQTKTISVTGTGTITSIPDTATVEFMVVTNGWSAKSIVSDNDVITKRLLDAIKNVGVNEEDIYQTECTVTLPTQQYDARRTVKVTTHNVKLVPSIIDCKIPGSQVRLGKTEYTISDEANILRRARTTAMQNAKDKASLLSGAGGCKIGDISYLSEGETETTITSDGKISKTVNVFITYNLE